MSAIENQLTTVETRSMSVYSNDDEFQKGMQIATALANTDLVPDSYKKKPENCLLALDVARQVKNSPLTVMQNLFIIKGKPSWSSTYISAVIHSRFPKVLIKWYTDKDDSENNGCRVIAYDSTGQEYMGTKITMKMAKADGWTATNAKKWGAMPEQMLQYRALAFFGRVHCPDLLLGIQSEYEIMDVPDRQEILNEKESFEKELLSDVIEAEVVETNDPQPEISEAEQKKLI